MLILYQFGFFLFLWALSKRIVFKLYHKFIKSYVDVQKEGLSHLKTIQLEIAMYYKAWR